MSVWIDRPAAGSARRYLGMAVTLCVLLAALALPVLAELPPLIPRDVLFSESDRRMVRLSPDGNSLGYLAPDDRSVPQIWVQALDAAQGRMLTHVEQPCIKEFQFACNGMQILYTADMAGNERNHLYALDLVSGESHDLVPEQASILGHFDIDANHPWEVLAGFQIEKGAMPYIVRINTRDGSRQIDTENPGSMVEWIPDSTFRVGAMIMMCKDGSREVVLPKRTIIPANTPYVDENGERSTAEFDREIVKYLTVDQWKRDEYGSLVRFENDDRNLVLISNRRSDTLRLILIDLDAEEGRVLAGDGEVDIQTTYAGDDLIMAAGFLRDRLEWQPLVDGFDQDLAALSALHEGSFEIVSSAGDSHLVRYYSDRDPATYYLYDSATQQGRRLFSGVPRLERQPLAEVKPITLKSRDQLTLHGYLTIPVGVPAKNLPMVLLVHGGPWERDVWQANPIVQWLANRGYAVLQINFRGSTGYGKKFLMAGFGEWGEKMQDDLIDGINWAIKQGIADPKRVAIMGSSYGGYATLVSLTRTPDLFKAGVDICGPGNLCAFLDLVGNGVIPSGQWVTDAVGDPVRDRERLIEQSPVFALDKVRVPLFVVQGDNDPRVPLAESDQVVNTLRQLGKEVTYVRYAEEGHGLARQENRLHCYALIEEFLAKHLAARG